MEKTDAPRTFPVRGASLVESPAIDSSSCYRHATDRFPSNKEDDKKKESKKRQREIRHDVMCLVCCDSVATGYAGYDKAG